MSEEADFLVDDLSELLSTPAGKKTLDDIAFIGLKTLTKSKRKLWPIFHSDERDCVKMVDEVFKEKLEVLKNGRKDNP